MKQYELKDHLGNVRVVLGDKKTRTGTNAFAPEVVSYSNYYPFGMQMYADTWQSPLNRYGYNGKEKDGELHGEGNSYDYGARIYDPRVGRWLSIDKYRASYPFTSGYDYAFNDPIRNIDVGGNWPWIANNNLKLGFVSYSIGADSKVKEFLDENQFDVTYIHHQLCSFYNVWSNQNDRHYAPKVAKFYKDEDTPVGIATFKANSYSNTGGETQNIYAIALNRSIFKQPQAYMTTEAVMFHEMIHRMGLNEFQAFSAQLAAGYITPQTIKDLYRASEPILNGVKEMLTPKELYDISNRKYFLQGIPDDLKRKYSLDEKTNPKFELTENQLNSLIQDMYNYGKEVIGTDKDPCSEDPNK